VNQLAQNLTTQVRSISEVASAVTKGDLTRTIRVEAKGEVEALKDTINQMITNLRETRCATGAGLVKIQSRQIRTDAAGTKRPEDRYPAHTLRTGTGSKCTLWRFLYIEATGRRAG